MIEVTDKTAQNPLCAHFTVCGGCSLQHLSPDDYRLFKKNLVHQRLGSLTPNQEEEMISIPPQSRRRASFKIEKRGKTCQLGYYKQRSHELVNITMCLLLTPKIVSLFAPLKMVLAQVLPSPSKGNVWILDSETGVDVAIEVPTLQKMTLPMIEALTDFARAHHLARICINTLWELTFREPQVIFSGHAVPASAKGFLQASAASDDALAQVVCDYLPQTFAQKALDLFCGRGTFSLLLAQHASHVDAVDMDVTALQALKHPKIKTYQQQLFKMPYAAQQISVYDVVVLDPPRDGALTQCQQISSSDCKTVIYVSCDVSTFARDAQILVDGGYTFAKFRIVDQFLWSPHAEVVGLFTK